MSGYDHLILRPYLPVLLACISFPLPSRAAEEWYKTAKYVCDDPLRLESAAFIPSWIAKAPPYLIQQPSTGLKYAEINEALLNKGTLALGKLTRYDSRMLEESDKALLKSHWAKLSSELTIASYSASAVIMWADFVGVSVGKPITSFLAFMLNHQIDSQKVTLHDLSFVTMKGGSIVRSVFMDGKDGDYIAIDQIEYEVLVGSEFMHMILKSCSYPANVVVRAVKTVGFPNPKILKEKQDGIWVMLNADANTVEAEYKLLNRDNDYYYFVRSGVGAIQSEIRLGRRGGPIERKGDEGWSTMYPKTEAF
jgi:hypothetical protein